MISTDVPSNRRFIQVVCAILWCLVSGGPIFGFAALKPVLVNEHVYESVCDISVNSTVSSSMFENFVLDPSTYGSLTASAISSVISVTSSNEAKCTAQDLKLNMMFTVGAVLTNVSALVIGRLLDVHGPRFCGLIGAAFLYLGSLVFIFAKSIESNSVLNSFLDPYLIGYGSLALGGPFAYISSFQLSNSFPHKSGTILALLTGAFDASSAVFLIYKIFYTKTNGAFTVSQFFKLYLLVPTFITLVQIFIMPKESYKTPPETTLCTGEHQPEVSSSADAATESQPLLQGSSRRDSIGDALKQPYAEEGVDFIVQHSGGIFGILHGYSAEYQLKTPWFYLMCAFATIQMLRLNYFVATITTQYTYLFQSSATAEKLTHFFDIALPLGGVISIPFIGLFLDYCSTTIVLSALLAVSLAIGVLGLLGSFIAGVLNVCIFVAYRPFFYTAVSDFCAKVFGFDTFGTVYGAIICTSGVFNFGQSILDKLTHTTFNMNPIPINSVLIALTVIIGGFTLTYVHTQTNLYNQKKQRQVSNLT